MTTKPVSTKMMAPIRHAPSRRFCANTAMSPVSLENQCQRSSGFTDGFRLAADVSYLCAACRLSISAANSLELLARFRFDDSDADHRWQPGLGNVFTVMDDPNALGEIHESGRGRVGLEISGNQRRADLVHR